MPDYHDVGPAAEVPPGSMKRYVVGGVPVAVYNCGGDLTATADTCTHAEASLAGGFLDCAERSVECPLHGAKFDVRSGKVLSLPAVTGVRVFRAKVEGERLLVAL